MLLNKQIFSVVIATILLSACSTTQIIENAYPDRVKFSFLNKYDDSTHTYLCQKGINKDDTKKRAETAHKFFTEKVDKISEQETKKLFKNKDSSLSAILRLNSILQKHGELLAKETEDKYQCLMIDVTETNNTNSVKNDEGKFKRCIYVKLPLKQPEYHWIFTEKDKFLQSKLLLNITTNNGIQNLSLLDHGKLSENWEILNDGEYEDNEMYFGFNSKNQFIISETDKVELILKTNQDIKGKGADAKGILKSGTYKSTGKFSIYDTEKYDAGEDECGFLTKDNWNNHWKLDITSNKGWMQK